MMRRENKLYALFGVIGAVALSSACDGRIGGESPDFGQGEEMLSMAVPELGSDSPMIPGEVMAHSPEPAPLSLERGTCQVTRVGGPISYSGGGRPDHIHVFADLFGAKGACAHSCNQLSAFLNYLDPRPNNAWEVRFFDWGFYYECMSLDIATWR